MPFGCCSPKVNYEHNHVSSRILQFGDSAAAARTFPGTTEAKQRQWPCGDLHDGRVRHLAALWVPMTARSRTGPEADGLTPETGKIYSGLAAKPLQSANSAKHPLTNPRLKLGRIDWRRFFSVTTAPQAIPNKLSATHPPRILDAAYLAPDILWAVTLLPFFCAADFETVPAAKMLSQRLIGRAAVKSAFRPSG
jgi:hypothetical protein